jgi:hypothetical protein
MANDIGVGAFGGRGSFSIIENTEKPTALGVCAESTPIMGTGR